MTQEKDMLNRRNPAVMHSQRGFTLSEILVTTAIFAIIMIAALAVYDQSNKVFKGSTEAADMQQSTRVGFDKLISDVRMAGFDYNRGGTPTNSWEVPQPDEQIEYAGPTAITFRANFNYNVNLSQGNGLEPSITPKNTTGQNIFPYVTTNNNEIVTYALRSADATKNTDAISFYVDDYTPRQVFPNGLNPAGGATSKTEHLLKLGPTTCGTCGLDLSNANPPYTLYRITVADVLAGQMGTPVAENIRSLNFKYYQDGTGQTLVTNAADNSAIDTGYNGVTGSTFTATGTGAIGGAGQYDPNSVGSDTRFVDRLTRSNIQSIKVDLVGMNATQDLQGYQNPTETIAAIKNYRQYALSSLVVPRNLGKTGFPEPVYSPPAPPTITGMCIGFCGAPVIYWAAPTAGGPVEAYEISWDTSPSGTFAAPHKITADPSMTSAILPDDGISDPTLTWYYRVVAINSNGSSPASALYSVVPLNNTKPKFNVTTLPHATDLTSSDMQPDKITLTFVSPTDNASPLNALSCSGTGGSTDGTKVPSVEPIKYKILRSTIQNFTAAAGQSITALDYTSGSQPAGGVPGSAVTWIDNPTNDTLPPANCVQYYYRIMAANRCRLNASYNTSGNAVDAESDPYPAWGTNALPGKANGSGTATAPAALLVDGASSNCPLIGVFCTIKLQWNKVTADTSGNATGIDTYRVTRYKKHSSNLPAGACGTTYCLDTSFGTGGYLDVSGYTALTGSTANWTDTTAHVYETSAPFIGDLMMYEYTVAAKECSTYGAESNTADYPTACSVSPTIVQAGAASGSGTGTTPADPWIFNSGDTITVTPPGAVTLSQVSFSISTYPGGVPVGSPTVLVSSPYVFGWSDLTDGQVYQVTIIVTTTAGCNETHIRYVQDQTIALCQFANITTVPNVSGANSGSDRNESYTLTVPNSGAETATLANQPWSISWTDPRGLATSGTNDTILSEIVWPTAITQSVSSVHVLATTTVAPTTATTTGTAPSGTSTIAAGSNLILTIREQHKKTEDPFPNTPSGLKKVCIAYTIPSEPGVVKKCNIVGQAASTANPANCD
jgi:prepilin-type N-terminal cleavage/methylation domain-containing protein